MNLLGKILTVLTLVMSISFMMIAVTVFATHRNWRDVVMDPTTGLKKQVEDLDRANKQLREELQRKTDLLAVEQAARQHALASLQARLQNVNDEMARLNQQYAELQAQHGSLVESTDTNTLNQKAITEEVTGLRAILREAEQARDAKFMEVTELQNQILALEGQRRLLIERQEQLIEQVKRMSRVLARNDLDEFTPVSNKPPKVDGVVSLVGNRNLIEITIGSDDGLRKGHTLEVFRDRSYLGRIRIEKTLPDKSVGRILPQYRKGTIKRGDRVATKLS